MRWLQLAERTHLRGRREQARLESSQRSKLLGSRQVAEALEQPLDEVDLRLSEGRVSSQMQRGNSVLADYFDDVAPRGPCEVRVVEDGLPRA